MTSGPATGRCQRALICRAALACLALMVLECSLAGAQTLTRDLMNPARGGFFQPQDSYLRRTSEEAHLPGTAAPQTEKQP